ncbi:unnamed protein product [Camellia sinensis]
MLSGNQVINQKRKQIMVLVSCPDHPLPFKTNIGGNFTEFQLQIFELILLGFAVLCFFYFFAWHWVQKLVLGSSSNVFSLLNMVAHI